MKYLPIIFVLLIIISGCAEKEVEPMEKPYVPQQPMDISLKTDDNVMIKAKFYPNEESDKGLVLLHQFAKDKSSYSEWITKFQETHNIIAIDLRGHGESSLNYQDFSDEDFVNMQYDIKAAKDFLVSKEISSGKISYIGASIGANTVQNFVSSNSFDKAVLLSPGTNYKGIMLTFQDNQIMVVVSEEDSYSHETVKKLEEVSPNSEFVYLQDKGHGTNMLDEELVGKIDEYLGE